jgi:membrane-associated phospholipid phosphatase
VTRRAPCRRFLGRWWFAKCLCVHHEAVGTAHFEAEHWQRMPRLRNALEAVARIDWASSRWVAAQRRPGLNELFVVGSHSGQLGIPWSALLVGLHFRASGGARVSIPRGLTITVGTWAAAHLIKRLDHRLRPCQDHDATPLVRCPKSSSLPSDEAACAFAAAVYAARKLPHLASSLYAGAAFTAVSRVYVGAHYPTDVAAGALLGTTIARAAS